MPRNLRSPLPEQVATSRFHVAQPQRPVRPQPATQRASRPISSSSSRSQHAPSLPFATTHDVEVEDDPAILLGRGNQSRYAEEEDIHEVETEALPQDEIYDEEEPVRRPTSTRRYRADDVSQQYTRPTYQTQSQIPSRRERYADAPTMALATRPRSMNLRYDAPPRQQRQRPAPRRGFSLHPLLWLGVGMLLFGLISYLLTLGFSWIHGLQDQMTYSYPRTQTVQQDIGHHGGLSTFTTLNLHGVITLKEVTAGNKNDKSYAVTTLVGKGADLGPVTLSFKDVLHRPGYLDVIVTYQSRNGGPDEQWIFYNIGDKGLSLQQP